MGFCLRIIGNFFWNNQLLMENRIMSKILSIIGGVSFWMIPWTQCQKYVVFYSIVSGDHF